MIESHKLKTLQQSRHDIPTRGRTRQAKDRVTHTRDMREKMKKKKWREKKRMPKNQFWNDNWINIEQLNTSSYKQIGEFYFVTRNDNANTKHCVTRSLARFEAKCDTQRKRERNLYKIRIFFVVVCALVSFFHSLSLFLSVSCALLSKFIIFQDFFSLPQYFGP